MDDDEGLADALDAWRAEESNRGLGSIPFRAQAALSPFSEAGMEAAGNLLDKALRALDDGDDDKARRMVERAAALPYDELERATPAAWMAHMAMFMAVTDAAEEDGGEDWLDAVIGTFIDAGQEARFVLRDCTTAMLQDYDLGIREQRRLREAMARIPERAQLHELELTPEQLTVAVLDVLEGVLTFADSYDELARLDGAVFTDD